jgi:L-amino acid N-acyltransferase YncA
VTKLRLATEADIPTLVEMGVDMFAGSSFAALTYAPDKAGEFMRRGIKGAFLAVSVEGEGGAITGCIYGDVIEPWYTSDCMGIEHFLYVRPEHRGSRAALMLVRAWIRWCVSSGAKQLRPATAAKSAEADRLYRAVGFEPVGQLYVMNQKDFP